MPIRFSSMNALPLSVPCAIVGLLISVSCGPNLKEIGPKMGETRRFPIPRTGQQTSKTPYSLSKLDQGYGLYVFSYEVRRTNDTLSGIRIWDHRFGKRNPDTISLLGEIPIHNQKSSSRGNESHWRMETIEQYFGEDNNFAHKMDFLMKYKKGCIVYGGRVIVSLKPRGMKL